MKVKVVANYCRVSTREQAEYGFSLLDQQEKNLFWLKMFPEEYPKGTVITNYVDEGESAGSLNRKEMNRLINDVKNGKINVVIVHNLDRLTRRLKDLIYMLELFQEMGVSLVSIKEKIETETAMGRFFIMIIILIAQWELETISERTKRGMDRSAKEGNYTKAKAPLGYNKNDKKLEIDETEAIIIRSIFNMYLIDHLSLFSIATYLNSICALDIVWTYNRISNILSNSIYIGEFSNHRISIPGHSPGIINENQFNLAQERLKLKNIVAEHQYVFKGLVRSSKDGAMAEHSSTVKPAKTYLYYLEEGSNRRINEDILLEQITIPINRFIQNKIKKRVKNNIMYQNNIDNQIKQILLLYDDGLVDEEFRDQQIESLKLKVTTLDGSLAKISRSIKKWSVMTERERITFASKYIESIMVDFNSKELVKVKFVKVSSMQGDNLKKK